MCINRVFHQFSNYPRLFRIIFLLDYVFNLIIKFSLHLHYLTSLIYYFNIKSDFLQCCNINDFVMFKIYYKNLLTHRVIMKILITIFKI